MKCGGGKGGRSFAGFSALDHEKIHEGKSAHAPRKSGLRMPNLPSP